MVSRSQQSEMKTVKGLSALLSCRLCRPECTQRRCMVSLLPGRIQPWLLPDLPGCFSGVIDLVQRKETPVDRVLVWQGLANGLKPRRGPIDIGSDVIQVYLKLNHALFIRNMTRPDSLAVMPAQATPHRMPPGYW